MTPQEVGALAIVFAGFVVFVWLLRLAVRSLERLADRSGKHRNGPAHVAFDDELVRYTSRRGEVREVKWSDLIEVGILTTDAGPASDDVFWMLVDGERQGCMVPSETVGMSALLKRLQQLPGFDNLAVARAMGSVERAKFVCWTRHA